MKQKQNNNNNLQVTLSKRHVKSDLVLNQNGLSKPLQFNLEQELKTNYVLRKIFYESHFNDITQTWVLIHFGAYGKNILGILQKENILSIVNSKILLNYHKFELNSTIIKFMAQEIINNHSSNHYEKHNIELMNITVESYHQLRAIDLKAMEQKKKIIENQKIKDESYLLKAYTMSVTDFYKT